MKVSDYKSLLFEIDDIFKKVGLKYFLYGGTCLGAFRDKKFIDTDTDIDIACLVEDFLPVKESLIKELEKNMKIEIIDYVKNKKWDMGIYVIKAKKNKIYCDIMILFKVDKYRTAPRRTNHFYTHNSDYCEKTKEIYFYDRIFHIPEKTEEYLKEFYGENWDKPVSHKKHTKKPNKKGFDSLYVKLKNENEVL